jgi:hypothetical protein
MSIQKLYKEDIVKSKGQSIERTNLPILLINELQKLYHGPNTATELREENFKKIPCRANYNTQKSQNNCSTNSHYNTRVTKFDKSLYMRICYQICYVFSNMHFLFFIHEAKKCQKYND